MPHIKLSRRGAQSDLARSFPVQSLSESGCTRREDSVAIEEPLEIRVCRAEESVPGRAIAVTMRTPGHDAELVAGYLVSEGIVRTRADLAGVHRCGDSGNVMRAHLGAGVTLDLQRVERNFYTSSSCGLCGKTSIEAAMLAVPLRQSANVCRVSQAILTDLPLRMRAAQSTFSTTGGLHAVALFSLSGELLRLREDVGRHNAFDKLVGASLLDKNGSEREFAGGLVLLSGRASFELVQKAMVVGAPIVAAIGAPSSLAIELAGRANITLVGFLRNGGFNIYTHGERIVAQSNLSGGDLQ